MLIADNADIATTLLQTCTHAQHLVFCIVFEMMNQQAKILSITFDMTSSEVQAYSTVLVRRSPVLATAACFVTLLFLDGLYNAVKSHSPHNVRSHASVATWLSRNLYEHSIETKLWYNLATSEHEKM